MRIKYALIATVFMVLSCENLRTSGYGDLTINLGDINSRVVGVADLQNISRFELTLTDSTDKAKNKKYIIKPGVGAAQQIEIKDPLYGDIIFELNAYNKYDLLLFAAKSSNSISKDKINNIQLILKSVNKMVSINLSFTNSKVGLFTLDPSKTTTIDSIRLDLTNKKGIFKRRTLTETNIGATLDGDTPRIVVNAINNFDILIANSDGFFDTEVTITLRPLTSTTAGTPISFPQKVTKLAANTYLASVKYG